MPSVGASDGSAQAAAAKRPPSRIRPLMCLSAPSMSGMNIRPQRHSAASKLAGGSSRCSAAAVRKVMLATPSFAARRSAPAIIDGLMSVATTWPSGATRRAAVTAGSPVPVATSSTRSPGPMPASATIRSLTGLVAFSMVSNQASQAPAVVSQPLRRSS